MTERKPIGLTVPYREVGYKEKKEWEIKRPWVGLTKKEMMDVINMEGTSMEMLQKIEAKLKEKNSG
jgi:hypothetical protein